jgi:hypothetical protein
MTNVQLGNNKNLFDKTYVGNIAQAILLASDKLHDASNANKVAGQVFFITNNDPRPFWDFMRALWSGFDGIFPDRPKNQKRQVVIPRAFALLLAYVMKFVGWITNKKEQTLTPYTVTFATATMYFSSAKAKRVLGYEPEVGVDEGIRKTLEVNRSVCLHVVPVFTNFYSGSKPIWTHEAISSSRYSFVEVFASSARYLQGTFIRTFNSFHITIRTPRSIRQFRRPINYKELDIVSNSRALCLRLARKVGPCQLQDSISSQAIHDRCGNQGA